MKYTQAAIQVRWKSHCSQTNILSLFFIFICIIIYRSIFYSTYAIRLIANEPKDNWLIIVIRFIGQAST